MRDAIKDLNKHTLAEATGISYSKLRKYATGIVKDLNARRVRKNLFIYQRSLKDLKQEVPAINQEEIKL